jgi:uncharacterized protein YukE
MSIEENAARLTSVVEKLGTIIDTAKQISQDGAEAITELQGVAGGNGPQALSEAMQEISAAQHELNSAVQNYANAQQKIEDYGVLLHG